MNTKIAHIRNMLESALVMVDFASKEEVLAGIYHECEINNHGDISYKTVSSFMYAAAAVLHISEAIRQCLSELHNLGKRA